MLPVIQGSLPWPVDDVFGACRAQSSAGAASWGEPGMDAAFDAALEWARAQARRGRVSERGGGTGLAFAAEGPSAPAAALLAAALGYRLQLCAGGFVERFQTAVRTCGGRSIVIVACRDEATDELLTSVSSTIVSALAGETNWEHLPKVTILTGRDLASLSWVVAKAIAASNRQDACASSRTVRHFTTDGASILMNEADGADPAGFRVRRGVLDRDALLASLKSVSAVVGYQTHGVDACAQGGDGVVLCGLHGAPGAHLPATPGILACGRGYPCPRGPSPIPLRETRAGVFMLGSCNGLRLADGILHPDFNLGLSFLDGPGHAYVSSTAAGFGSELGTMCFLAAYASGRNLAEATLLVNAFVYAAKLDDPTYIAVGLPECGMPGAGEVRGSDPAAILDGGCAELDFGDRHFAELLIENAELIARARTSRVSFAVSSDLDEPVYWFCRIERRDAGRDAPAAPQLRLRVFLFRFPQALGRLRIDADDAGRVRADVVAALGALPRWLETVRLTGSSDQRRASLAELMDCESTLRAAAAARLRGLDFDGTARRTAEILLARTDSLAEVARRLVVEDLVPQLTGEFWLPNVWSREYYFADHRQITCPYCGGGASSKLLKHELHSHSRAVIVCLRCLIVSDLPSAGGIEGMTIEAPTLARAGTSMTVSVTVTGEPSSGDVEVHLRMPARAGNALVPRPLYATCRLNGAPQTVNFQWDLPRGLLPHQYRLKALATSLREIAFAQRPFFVGPA